MTGGCWWGGWRRPPRLPGAGSCPAGRSSRPKTGTALDVEALRRHAARELAEEVGRDVAHQELELWAVTRGDKGNVGVHFRAPACPADALAAQYTQLVAAESARGRTPELDRIAFIASDADVAGLGGRCADFLPVLAARHAAGDTTDQPHTRR